MTDLTAARTALTIGTAAVVLALVGLISGDAYVSGVALGLALGSVAMFVARHWVDR